MISRALNRHWEEDTANLERAAVTDHFEDRVPAELKNSRVWKEKL